MTITYGKKLISDMLSLIYLIWCCIIIFNTRNYDQYNIVTWDTQ